jgi:hypothetical protein
MGGGRWDSKEWDEWASSSSYSTKRVEEIYTSTKLHSDLNVFGKDRESCDSPDNPKSTPIIIGLDVTGSMGLVLEEIARKGLNTLCTEIHARKPVSDPHILCAGIGDVEYDRAPFQATQFEADLRIAKELEKLYLEGGGGGNSYESYALAWYFAAHHTKCDAFNRGKKGYLFTIGDENPTAILTKNAIEKVFGDRLQADVDMDALLTLASRKYEIFHVVVEQGDHARRNLPAVMAAWRTKLGQRVLPLSKVGSLAEVIVSAIACNEGANVDTVSKSWSGDTSMVVSKALSGMVAANTNANTGLVSL